MSHTSAFRLVGILMASYLAIMLGLPPSSAFAEEPIAAAEEPVEMSEEPIAPAEEPAEEPVATEAATGMSIQDGMAQPVFAYSNVEDKGYTNAASEIWRFAVFVETDYDTDQDGKCDLVKAYVQVPRAAVEGDGSYRAPVIFSADPYSAGHVENGSTFTFKTPAVDDAALMSRPAHRIGAGTQSTKDLALATTFGEPSSWTQEFDYYLVRGFAIVQSAGLGTYGSEGIECAGTVMERDAFVCIVEWLTGKDGRHAFADVDATKEVRADWSSGKVGMTGLSYPGAMCYEVATSGVAGLMTIVPLAGPSSWYDNVNRQGISKQYSTSYNYMTVLSDACASRLFASHSPAAGLVDLYGRYRRYVNDAQTALAGDYGPFWAARDWYTKGTEANMTASALIVSGLNDKNVSTKHFDLMRDAFLLSGCEVKTLLHQNLHVKPNSEDVEYDDKGNTRTVHNDIMVCDHSYQEWLNLWFTRALLGVDNDAASLPEFMVQSNVDGSFFGTDRWNENDSIAVRPNDAGETTVYADARTADEEENDAIFTSKASRGAALWTHGTGEQVTIAGRIGVHVRAKVSDVSAGDIMMSAILQDVADEPFSTFAVNDQVTSEKVGQRTDSPHDFTILRWTPGQVKRKTISDGRIDLRNPEAGYEPATATKRDVPIEANTYYDYTIWLDPTYYTVPVGHRLELYLVPSYGYARYPSDETRDYMLGKQGLDTSSLMHVRYDYAVTIANAESFSTLPIAEAVSYDLVSQGASTWTKGSTDPLSLTWKRTIDDGETFFHFDGVVVDGEPVSEGGFSAKSGSVVVDLLPEYLQTLPAGEHTVYAEFDDGEGAAATFTVEDGPSPAPAPTPEPTPDPASSPTSGTASPSTESGKDEATATKAQAKTPSTADTTPLVAAIATAAASLALIALVLGYAQRVDSRR